ncbi:hypothetical protein EMPS_06765 [Entomortierella parvispora]|uniref:Uncharacterized protein n=1 Tax=Entomortierella parvispora TaxID=205924 RepID=A0A9P3LXS4_9FUNG|nr:hypothetical protein EMPS_06765 [Entomortierella parvispora]
MDGQEVTNNSGSNDNTIRLPETAEDERTLTAVLKPQKPDADLCLNFLDSYEEYFEIIGLAGLTLATDWDTFRDKFEKRFTPPDAVV